VGEVKGPEPTAHVPFISPRKKLRDRSNLRVPSQFLARASLLAEIQAAR
jgi:hypothetical protein